MNEKHLDELLAGHALHALSPEEERELETELAAHPELRDRAVRDEGVAAALAEATPEVAPPPGIRDELLAQISRDPVTLGREEDDADPLEERTTQRQARRRLRRRVLALAASVVLVAAVGAGAVVATQLLNRPEAVVALDSIESAEDTRTVAEPLADGGTLEIHWSHDVREAVVIAEDVPPLAAGQQYELWFVRDEAPISAGVFDGGTDDPVLLDGTLEPGDVVAVTIEQSGGSPTGAPTTDPIVAVPTE
ncbi:anti-sigma factor [Microbacterium karelineae]|uniref:anti-sigma factor n=1 Tax=Microbacterium karelineae TaxID=2654283 RepID=UPI0012E9F0B9|nr:anti-sigma factor [Microbacterium karelineae]